MRKLILIILVILVAAIAALFRPGALEFQTTTHQAPVALDHAQTAADRGIVQFAYGDWGALSSHTLQVSAVPWKLSTAALALGQADGDPARVAQVDLAAVFRQWGMHSPDEIANWPDHIPQPDSAAPLGQITGTARAIWPPLEVTIGNSVCAACHSSVTYDAFGQPDTSRVWLGMGNSSINLQGYTQTLFETVRDMDDARLMEATLALYPETSQRERLTLRYAILPRLRAVIEERDEQYGAFLPFTISSVGATNGLDSLRNRLDLIPRGEQVTQSTFNSLHDLGDRLLRRRLLLSGSYALPEPDRPMTPDDITETNRNDLAAMIAYFTVPAMGVSVDEAAAHQNTARDVVAWLETYEPQPFPGAIDHALTATGQEIYARACASCHGTYDRNLSNPELMSFPNWHAPFDTDPERARLVTQDFADAANQTLFGNFQAVTTDGYSAPPLSGIWTSAPYLHNGSVPTLWHLMRPETRPGTFMVGGHALDLDLVGIAGNGPDWSYADEYVPWSTPTRIDTTEFGMGNQGHAVGFDGLSESEKDALLEYLKLL